MLPQSLPSEFKIDLRDIASSFLHTKTANGVFKIILGELVLLHGENGVGKSTFVRAVKMHCYRDLLIFSFCEQMPLTSSLNLSVAQLLADYCDLIVFNQTRYQSLFDAFELDKLIQQEINDLSGGQKQMLKLLMCLSKEAHFYFLDEPFVFLDQAKQSVVNLILAQLKKTKGILLINHQNTLELAVNRRYQLIMDNQQHLCLSQDSL
jgi:translation initiation factor RLI1